MCKKGSKKCEGSQVAIVELPEQEEEDCNIVDTNSEENYSVLRITKASFQTESVRNLEVINSATGKTKCLRTTLKAKGSRFSATIDTGRPRPS